MPSLILWRHAKSSWSKDGLADHDRPLNSRGRTAAQMMARHLAGLGRLPGQVLCSTAQRTRETLEPLLSLIQSDATITLTRDIYQADAQSLLDLIRKQPMTDEPLMVIGHNPTFEDLTSALVAPETILAHPNGGSLFPAGALAMLSCPLAAWADLSHSDAGLEMFIRPRDLQGQ